MVSRPVRSDGEAVTRCPVCGAGAFRDSVDREVLPAMQNHVHRTRESALAAGRGPFTLSTCERCGFSWNRRFDPARLVYDDAYDNLVPSAVMARYYDDIATYLGEKYGLANGYVVDVGCGRGTFLEALARRWPSCRALGVDPALQGDATFADGRVRLVKGVFDESLLEAPPSLFVSRHVLEHMPQPPDFVAELRRAVGERVGTPLFIEVPDLGWILRHGAFWDFCYEHCNYFTAESLAAALRRGGFAPSATRVAYGDQYRWMEAVAADAPGAEAADDRGAVAAMLSDYTRAETDAIGGARARLAALRADGAAVVVWGMATKGVMFSLLIDPAGQLIDAAVDVNPNKQGCFVPISARPIEAPERLRQRGSQSLAIVVMNPNYMREVRETCGAMGLSARFFEPGGAEV